MDFSVLNVDTTASGSCWRAATIMVGCPVGDLPKSP